MFTETPNRISASTLSPSVTATLRMLSPKRARRIERMVAAPAAARAHCPMRSATTGSLAWPATVLRASPIRVWMKPNSRSPWAAWLRFMKSMSMVAQGRSRLACVCRCSSGLRRASRPEIHILAGLKVCIQAITPTHESSALASIIVRRIASASLRTGLNTISNGIASEASSVRTISPDCSATWASTSSPYRVWLPVRNQIW